MDSAFIEQYDSMILSSAMRRMYKGSFYNVGDWSRPGMGLDEACVSLMERHLALVSRDKGLRSILDAGCGLGASTAMLAERFPDAEVTGINISPRQVEYARRQYKERPNKGPDFEVMDAARLSFPDASFDLVVAVEAVFHFNPREDFLSEAYRVLRPGGQLIFSDVLLYDTYWVGDWSVPVENLLPGIAAYMTLLGATPFSIDRLEDITGRTWMGFCRHLESMGDMGVLAGGLRDSIIAYLLVKLGKPPTTH